MQLKVNNIHIDCINPLAIMHRPLNNLPSAVQSNGDLDQGNYLYT